MLQGSSGGTGDVRAKVLDFGLAKPVAVDLADSPPPSGSFHGTADGRILGTPAYMSPEQARGLTVDKRTDIWAFGCVLFEMLTGRRAFEGATITDTLAQVLEREPDWTRLPAQTPPSIRALLDRCLRKDPRRRLHDVADALVEMDDAARLDITAGAATDEPRSRPRRNRQRLTWIAAGILAGVLLTAGLFVVLSRRANPIPDLAYEFALTAPAGSRFPGTTYLPFAIAPDGSHVALLAVTGGAEQSLWIRPLGSSAAWLLPGFQVRIEPFSLSAVDLAKMEIDPSWTYVPLLKFPLVPDVRAGDNVAIDLLENPTTGQKVVDYFVFKHSNATAVAELSPVRDLSLDDVEMRLEDFRISVNGTVLEASTRVGGSISGAALWFYLPERGRFVMSLVPNGNLGFQRAGEVTNALLSFTERSDRYDIKSTSRIAPAAGRFNLYVLHDPEWRPTGDEANSPIIVGAAGRAEWLIGK